MTLAVVSDAIFATVTGASHRNNGKKGGSTLVEHFPFFHVRGSSKLIEPRTNTADGDSDSADSFFAFERTNFGIVHVRTDGERVLAFTYSGKAGVNEGYGFDVDAGSHINWRKEVAQQAQRAEIALSEGSSPVVTAAEYHELLGLEGATRHGQEHRALL